jgi:hypothetical protein
VAQYEIHFKAPNRPLQTVTADEREQDDDGWLDFLDTDGNVVASVAADEVLMVKRV